METLGVLWAQRLAFHSRGTHVLGLEQTTEVPKSARVSQRDCERKIDACLAQVLAHLQAHGRVAQPCPEGFDQRESP